LLGTEFILLGTGFILLGTGSTIFLITNFLILVPYELSRLGSYVFVYVCIYLFQS
jgi:hypothetical protein